MKYTQLLNLPTRLRMGASGVKNAPISRNGMPNPNEYDASRMVPFHAVSEFNAIVSTLARIGLRQGVQATVNEVPITKDAK